MGAPYVFDDIGEEDAVVVEGGQVVEHVQGPLVGVGVLGVEFEEGLVVLLTGTLGDVLFGKGLNEGGSVDVVALASLEIVELVE